MYIRRTTIKSRKDGKRYYTYRLVESKRTVKGVRQRTLLNLGKDFPYPRELWPDIVQRIEDIITGQQRLFPLDKVEVAAQRYAALLLQSQARAAELDKREIKATDYREIDVESLEMLRPRTVGIEHVAYEAIKRLELEKKLYGFGFSKPWVCAAIGTIVGRMAHPGSELSTFHFLRSESGLGELIDYDFQRMNLIRLYQVSDQLYKRKEELESFLYSNQSLLFGFKDTIILYDLTNTFFEGTGKYNDLANRGRSKEKRTDCPLVTLGLVMGESGFPKRSRIFAGNASEPKTLEEMLQVLCKNNKTEFSINEPPVVVLDAGIATEDNVKWLREKEYFYLVVSRKRHREFNENSAVTVKKDKRVTVKVQRVPNEETGEIELYCHSIKREGKECAIIDRFSKRLEEDLTKLDLGLKKKGTVKKYDKILERIGRLKEKYSRIARQYEIKVEKNEETGNAQWVKWKRKVSEDLFPGVYCLRTNKTDWNESTLWHTYTMLTDVESVFRSLKSELGLRPIYHHL